MSSPGLACVFGPHLIWPSQGVSPPSALVPLSLFTELLIEYYETVFGPPEAPGEHAPGPAQAGGQGSPSPGHVPGWRLPRPRHACPASVSPEGGPGTPL